jgi:transposase
MSDMQGTQRSAVVFGARNLGRAVIELLVSDGWAVAGVARSQSTLEGVGAAGALALEADVTDPASVYGVLEHAAAAHGGVELTEGEREQLESWSRRHTTAQALALRSRIVLAAAEGPSSSQIAKDLGISVATVGKWRNRFAKDRLDGLVDEPRPGRPRTITDAKVDEVIVKTLDTKPKNATHWSTRSMAREVGLTQTAVNDIWRAFGLKPRLQEKWKLSTDPQFVAKVRHIVGLYLNPPERAVVLAVDEKSQIQALDRTRPILPMLPGTPGRASHDYSYGGTVVK